jgi:hypothetical protein
MLSKSVPVMATSLDGVTTAVAAEDVTEEVTMLAPASSSATTADS